MRDLVATPAAPIWLGYDPATAAGDDGALVIVVRAKRPARLPLTLNRISALTLTGIALGLALVAAIGGAPALALICGI